MLEAAAKAIAEPRRRQILTLVRDGELSSGDIAAHFDVTRAAISQHFGVLKEAGLMTERRNGTRRLYRARPEGLTELKQFLDGFWDERLNALRREAEQKEAIRRGSNDWGIAVERELTIAESPVVPGNTARGAFVEIDPPRRLVFRWGWESGVADSVPPGSTTVEFELEPAGDGTLLRFRHRNLPTEDSAASHAHGWDHYLERLATLAGGDDPGDDPWVKEEMT